MTAAWLQETLDTANKRFPVNLEAGPDTRDLLSASDHGYNQYVISPLYDVSTDERDWYCLIIDDADDLILRLIPLYDPNLPLLMARIPYDERG